jgi:hypothetical protein
MQLLCEQIKTQADFLNFAIPQETPSESLSKIEKIFEENRTGVLALLRQKRKVLSKDVYLDLVEKVKTVSLGSFNDDSMKKLFYGACNRPNAIYIRSMHKILVCPSLQSFPELTLYQILAHELGHVVQKMQQSIHCFESYPKTQTEEAFADWVASKVVSAKINLEKDPKVAHKNAIESQLLFLSLACQGQSKIKPDWAKSHPSLQSRVENIFLAQPELQNAIQCEPKSAKSCG